MRRALGAALGAVASLFLLAGAAGAALEPVGVTIEAPGTVTAGAPFKFEVTVEAEPGALDLAAQPLLLAVKLAPECGGSLVGTSGDPLFERALTVPAGTALKQTFAAEATTGATGTEVLCAFLQDSQERQFATDTEAEVTVTPASAGGTSTAPGPQHQCTAAATRRLTAMRLDLKLLSKRIAKLRHRVHRAHGAHRMVLAKNLRKLRAKRRKLAKRRLLSAKTHLEACA